MNKLISVIIPSRNEPYLPQTLAELFKNAAGEIEVIVVLDGPLHPDYNLPDYPGLKIVNNPQVKGLRWSINKASEMAKGKYIMKIDAHCMIGEGWDEILQADCEDNWIVVPRRYWLDAPKWKVIESRHVDAMRYLYPFIRPYKPRLTSRPLYEDGREEILIDEDMGYQGSCWFTLAKHFKRLGGFNEHGYGTFADEQLELGLKTQLGPWEGKIMRNKKTWYAHWAKPGSHWRADPEVAGRVTDQEREAGFYYSFDFWWHNRWPERVHDFEWLVDKFWPLPGWPDDWRWRSTQYNIYELPRVSD
jgi:glycosyltransferase involved in cell wall biosynthesis